MSRGRSDGISWGLLDLKDRTNAEWLHLLAQSGPAADEAIAELRERLKSGLRKALRGQAAGDDGLLDDLTQDALVKVLNSLDSFRGDSRLTTWAISIGVRVAFSELRRARWRDVSLDGLAEGGMALEPEVLNEVESQTEKAELISLMRRIIETELSERQRFVLVAELNGMPQVAVCDRLQLSTNALYKLTYDARQKLKRGLLASGVTETDVREVFGFAS